MIFLPFFDIIPCMTEQVRPAEAYSRGEIEKILTPPAVGQAYEPFKGSLYFLFKSMEKEFPGSSLRITTQGVELSRVFEENHDVIPDQNGPAKVTITTTFNSKGLIPEVRVSRENSRVPSTFTHYTYEERDGKNMLWATNTYILDGSHPQFLVEAHRGGEPSPFPGDFQVQELFKVFRQPKPGEAVPDLRPYIEKAKAINHPAVQVIEDEKGEAILLSNFYTDTIPGLGVTHLDVSLVRFIGKENTKIISLTTISLHGVDDRAVESTFVRREFYYTDGKLTGRDQYVGGELIYSDNYSPRIFTVEGRDYEVFDTDRTYGEWGKKESGRSGEYRRVVAVDPKTGAPTKYKFSEKK